ncbi:MAG: hypothetical protein C0626_01305 [Arcobacter sp.]|nr:MAG: hypothetical protein C0626_01305 [Arcobacter sp.]
MNEIDEGIDSTKKITEVVGELIKHAGDTPEIKESGKNLGQAALTITKTINNALLPLAAINYSFDKAKKYFSEKFEKDMEKKASKILEEDLVEPKASIAGPTLQGLAFSHEENNLKEMYLSLLTTAMNKKEADNAHPAYVEIIKQLTSSEANLLKLILNYSVYLPICQIIERNTKNNSEQIIKNHITNVKGTEKDIKKIPASIENFIRLGLIKISYSQHLVDLKSYIWIESLPIYKEIVASNIDSHLNITYKKGYIAQTDLGIEFSKAVGLSEIK